MTPFRVILLPGSVLPAGPAYGRSLEALGTGVDALAKDLELYAADSPPADWTLDRIEPERVAALLQEHWARAEGSPGA